jgi:hypothetical protein
VAWITKNLGIDQPQVVVTTNKSGFASLAAIDASLEDNGENASKIGQAIGYHKSYLISRLYNSQPHRTGALRVGSVKEWLEKIM